MQLSQRGGVLSLLRLSRWKSPFLSWARWQSRWLASNCQKVSPRRGGGGCPGNPPLNWAVHHHHPPLLLGPELLQVRACGAGAEVGLWLAHPLVLLLPRLREGRVMGRSATSTCWISENRRQLVILQWNCLQIRYLSSFFNVKLFQLFSMCRVQHMGAIPCWHKALTWSYSETPSPSITRKPPIRLRWVFFVLYFFCWFLYLNQPLVHAGHEKLEAFLHVAPPVWGFPPRVFSYLCRSKVRETHIFF